MNRVGQFETQVSSLQDSCGSSNKDVDRLRTQIQEMQLTASQVDMAHRAEVADREEHLSKLVADVRVLEERLAQSHDQVRHYISV